MKKIFTIVSFFVFTNTHSQIDQIVKNTVETITDQKIVAFEKTLDSILIRNVTTTGSFNLDTIRIPVGGSGLYQISIKGNYGANMASGVRFFAARNDNGIYTIKRSSDDLAFSGITGHSWAAVVINNFLVVRVTSAVAYLIKWEYRRMNL